MTGREQTAFDAWATAKNPKYRSTDDSVSDRSLREAFAAGAASRDAEIVELKAQQCTSPFADSPPCRGIQRERDTIAELVAALEVVRNRFFPANQSERDRDILWDLVNDALDKVRKP